MPILAHGPAVEHFVHDQKPQPVAQIEKLRRGRIMGGPNCVTADLLKELQPVFPDSQRNGCAQGAPVVVEANAFELEVLPV